MFHWLFCAALFGISPLVFQLTLKGLWRAIGHFIGLWGFFLMTACQTMGKDSMDAIISSRKWCHTDPNSLPAIVLSSWPCHVRLACLRFCVLLKSRGQCNKPKVLLHISGLPLFYYLFLLPALAGKGQDQRHWAWLDHCNPIQTLGLGL